MNQINIYPLKDSGIMLLSAIRSQIKINPEYQRMGDIWTLEKKQLLIDSILNGFDIPKLYFHKYIEPQLDKETGQINRYAIIDGRQRLESIWGFIDGKFNLSEEFEYFEDKTFKAAGLSYGDLGKEYPILKLIFDQTSLPIICVETNDIGLIEEMFSRLNEAVTLNAAEKRNALGGPMAKAIIKVSNHKFFAENVAFPNRRYQHREMAAKFLLLDYSDKIIDTKRAFLDKLVKDFKKKETTDVHAYQANVEKVMNRMSKVFIKKDQLLKTQGMAVLYFLIFRNEFNNETIKRVSRKAFIDFDELRQENRRKAESELASAKFELLEFDSASQQGVNDGASIRFRYDILRKYLEAYLSGRKNLLGVFE